MKAVELAAAAEGYAARAGAAQPPDVSFYLGTALVFAVLSVGASIREARTIEPTGPKTGPKPWEKEC